MFIHALNSRYRPNFNKIETSTTKYTPKMKHLKMNRVTLNTNTCTPAREKKLK